MLFAPTVSRLRINNAELPVYLDRQPGVSYARITLLDDLISGLKSDAIWTLFDAIYLLANFSKVGSRQNLIENAFNCTEQGTVTFVQDDYIEGPTLNVDYYETGLEVTQAGLNFTRNLNHFSVWVGEAGVSSAQSDMVTTPSVQFIINVLHSSLGNPLYRNSQTTNQNATAITPNSGLWLGVRTSSTAIALRHYVESTGSASTRFTSSSATSQALTQGTFTIGNSTRRIRAASVGTNMDTTQSAAFNQRLRTYLLAIGAI